MNEIPDRGASRSNSCGGRLALLACLAFVVATPAAAQNPGAWNVTANGSSSVWRWTGGSATWVVTGTFDGATVTVEADNDPDPLAQSWVTVRGSSVTSPGTRHLLVPIGDVRLTLAGAGVSTDITATLKVAGRARLGVDAEFLAGTPLDLNDVPADTEVLTYAGASGEAEWQAAGGGGDSTQIEDTDGTTVIDTDAIAETVTMTSNGVEWLRGSAAATDVNSFDMFAAGAGAGPVIATRGADADIPVRVRPTGVGKLELAGGLGTVQDGFVVGMRVLGSNSATPELSITAGSQTWAFRSSANIFGPTTSGGVLGIPGGSSNSDIRVGVSGALDRGGSLRLFGANNGGDWELIPGDLISDVVPEDARLIAPSAKSDATTNQDGADIELTAGDHATGGGNEGLIRIARGGLQPWKVATYTCAAGREALWIDSDEGDLCYCDGTANVVIHDAGAAGGC